jgi:hypothetical protein
MRYKNLSRVAFGWVIYKSTKKDRPEKTILAMHLKGSVSWLNEDH